MYPVWEGVDCVVQIEHKRAVRTAELTELVRRRHHALRCSGARARSGRASYERRSVLEQRPAVRGGKVRNRLAHGSGHCSLTTGARRASRRYVGRNRGRYCPLHLDGRVESRHNRTSDPNASRARRVVTAVMRTSTRIRAQRRGRLNTRIARDRARGLISEAARARRPRSSTVVGSTELPLLHNRNNSLDAPHGPAAVGRRRSVLGEAHDSVAAGPRPSERGDHDHRPEGRRCVGPPTSSTGRNVAPVVPTIRAAFALSDPAGSESGARRLSNWSDA